MRREENTRAAIKTAGGGIQVCLSREVGGGGRGEGRRIRFRFFWGGGARETKKKQKNKKGADSRCARFPTVLFGLSLSL
jgi:hypothetical protein